MYLAVLKTLETFLKAGTDIHLSYAFVTSLPESKIDDLRLEQLLTSTRAKLKNEGTINEHVVAASYPKTHSIVSPTPKP